MNSRTIFSTLALALIAGSAASAAENTHEGHAAAAPVTTSPKPITSPASGKAREAGYDGRDMMESTTAENLASVQCAQAARGLIMLDRAAAVQCTGAAAETQAPSAIQPAPQPQPHQH